MFQASNGSFRWIVGAWLVALGILLASCAPRYERDENCTFEDRKMSCTWQQIDRYSYLPISRDELKSNKGDIEAGAVVKVAVLVEDSLGYDLSETTAFVMDTLTDPRGWRGIVGKQFIRVSPDEASIKILLTEPQHVDALCYPLRTNSYLSCRRRDRTILNAARWENAVPHWPRGALEDYRAYLVNHEVGHFLGKFHVPCPRAGRLAPVMMQQSKSLGGCRANGWPNPSAK